MSKPSVISLFTGVGGLDHGFEAAGLRTAVAVEMDGRCVSTLRGNVGWPVIERDVAGVDAAELLEAAGLVLGEPDVLIGGPPCQPFSKAGFWASGQAARLGDPRAATLGHYLRILEETRPKAFLLENVEGLGFRGKDEGLSLIREAMAGINARTGTNYSTAVATLNAADYGVPQIRRRLFVVGARDGSTFRFPGPTHADPAESTLPGIGERWRTAWDALHDLPDPDGSDLAIQGKWAALLPSIPEGQNYLWHTPRGGGEPLFGWRRRYWSFLLKLARDRPSWTLAAQPGPATGPFHWNNRRLSAKEMMRLQTFPDGFVLAGPVADAQRQLGNAVPSLLAEVLAREIRRQLLGGRLTNEPPSLAVPCAMAAFPLLAAPARVPMRYLDLRGDHEAHPGTGRGYGALGRETALTACD